MNLLKKNKDGSVFYYWKTYQQLEGGFFRFLDGDLLPIKNTPEDLSKSEIDFIEKSFLFDMDLFDQHGIIHIYLKLSKKDNSVSANQINTENNYDLEEIRFVSYSKEEQDYQQTLIHKGQDYKKNLMFDGSFKKYQYEDLSVSMTDTINSARGYLAFFNKDDEEIKEYLDKKNLKFYGKKLKQNTERHNEEIDTIKKIIPHFDEMTEPHEHICYDYSRNNEHGFGIRWLAGEYNIHHINAHQKTHMFNKKEINIHMPCCKKIIDYEKGEFVNRWGVSYLRCNDCDKNHPISKNDNNFKKECYKLKDGSDIDYSWQGIEDIFHPDTVSFYGWVIRPKTKDTSEVDFMHHD